MLTIGVVQKDGASPYAGMVRKSKQRMERRLGETGSYILLDRLHSQSYRSPESGLEAMVKYAIAKAQESTRRWRAEVEANC